MHSVFCAIDGTPQLYQGQALGYDQPSGQFSVTRTEFDREIDANAHRDLLSRLASQI